MISVSERQPRLLVIWGKYDLLFDPREPERYREDVPKRASSRSRRRSFRIGYGCR